MHACIYAYLHMYVHMNLHICIQTEGRRYIQTCIHSYIHINIHTSSTYEHTRRVQKMPNFLNSTPTSTEGVLRLLSAPSNRFWQQTAICPISLWALVVELHLLNWARAQAVCWISDKVTMKELEQCVCVKS